MTLEFKPTRSQLAELAELLQPLLRASKDSEAFDDALPGFLSALHGSKFMVPYDWMTYVASREEEWKDPAVLQGMDAETFQRFVIAHVRNDRFVQGHLQHLAESGYLAEVAARARDLAAAS